MIQLRLIMANVCVHVAETYLEATLMKALNGVYTELQTMTPLERARLQMNFFPIRRMAP